MSMNYATWEKSNPTNAAKPVSLSLGERVGVRAGVALPTYPPTGNASEPKIPTIFAI